MADQAVHCAAVARTVARATGRMLVAVMVMLVAAFGVALLTAVPGYRRVRRGAIGLQLFSRIALRALGIRVVSRGAPRSGASLVVANHSSWVDLLVLSATAPMLPVLEPAVVRQPVIGRLLARTGTLITPERTCRELQATVDRISAALRQGHRVQVFPTGAARGQGIQDPFHRAVFQAAVDAAVVISPVVLVYGPAASVTILDDGESLRSRSLWRLLRAGPLTVRVQWLPVIPAIEGAGHRSDHRAAAAARTERAIGRALGLPVRTRPGHARTQGLEVVASVSPDTTANEIARTSSGGTAMARVA